MSTTKALFPCLYIAITSGFKTTSRPNHTGIDLGWNRNHGGANQNILASFDGKVIDIKNNVADGTGTSYGNYIMIESTNDKSMTSLVAHLKYNSAKVKKGDQVKQGEVIALMGNTGDATGNHCHFEIRINGTRVNPLIYTYATKDMTIAQSTLNNYKIQMLEDTVYPDVTGVSKNTSFDQLQVLINNLRVRKSPILNDDNQVGWAVENAYYNYFETTNNDGYTWYRIGNDQWLAYKDTWVNVIPKTVVGDCEEQLKALQSQIEELEHQRDMLTNDNLKLKTENEELTILLQEANNYKFKYIALKDGNYKIKLYENEIMLIK